MLILRDWRDLMLLSWGYFSTNVAYYKTIVFEKKLCLISYFNRTLIISDLTETRQYNIQGWLKNILEYGLCAFWYSKLVFQSILPMLQSLTIIGIGWISKLDYSWKFLNFSIFVLNERMPRRYATRVDLSCIDAKEYFWKRCDLLLHIFNSSVMFHWLILLMSVRVCQDRNSIGDEAISEENPQKICRF